MWSWCLSPWSGAGGPGSCVPPALSLPFRLPFPCVEPARHGRVTKATATAAGWGDSGDMGLGTRMLSPWSLGAGLASARPCHGCSQAGLWMLGMCWQDAAAGPGMPWGPCQYQGGPRWLPRSVHPKYPSWAATKGIPKPHCWGWVGGSAGSQLWAPTGRSAEPSTRFTARPSTLSWPW